MSYGARATDSPPPYHNPYGGGGPSGPSGKTTEEALTPMRQVIGQRLLESKTHIPHFYVRQELDAGALVAMRDELKKLELSYTINDLIVKATALALSRHPEINSGAMNSNRTRMFYRDIKKLIPGVREPY